MSVYKPLRIGQFHDPFSISLNLIPPATVIIIVSVVTITVMYIINCSHRHKTWNYTGARTVMKLRFIPAVGTLSNPDGESTNFIRMITDNFACANK